MDEEVRNQITDYYYKLASDVGQGSSGQIEDDETEWWLRIHYEEGENMIDKNNIIITKNERIKTLLS